MAHMQGLTLFHALGKLLYNKRVEEDDPAQPSGTASQPAAGGAHQGAGAVAVYSQPPAAFSQPCGGVSARSTASQPALGTSVPSAPLHAHCIAVTSSHAGLSGPAATAAQHQQPQRTAAQLDVIDLTDGLADEHMADAVEPKPPDTDGRYAIRHGKDDLLVMCCSWMIAVMLVSLCMSLFSAIAAMQVLAAAATVQP